MQKYIRDDWEAKTPPNIKKGDNVLATKYRDGDPGDEFCVGFYDHTYQNDSSTRHIVVNGEGVPFRRNGFRRIARVSKKRGELLVSILKHIEAMRDRFSVWHWYRAPLAELKRIKP